MGVKASFDHIYNLEDPRGYYGALRGLGYRAPDHGSRLFPRFLEARGANGSSVGRMKVLDLCCSYGVNAALLKHELVLEDLYVHYGSEELSGLSDGALVEADAAFYKDRRSSSPPEVVGVDVAGKAVSYALQVGLLDAGFDTNLEKEEPPAGLRSAVEGADMVTVTGGVGYVWTNTFDRVLSCFEGDPTPWVATFPLRMVDYSPVAETLAGYGLVTEKLTTRTFPQRRFVDDREQEHVLRELKSAGIDTAGKEDTGWYHSELYLSRPPDKAAEGSLEELAGV